ncbi:MAG: LexA family transcriptional regulator [Ignavibacteria bacterium]|nr:LexA family transcriptional regulator [Ignavibacteria bacterium]
MDRNLFSKRLLEFCRTVSPTLTDFASKLGMKPQALQKYVKGQRLPLPDILNKINKLGCNINWLLNGEGEMLKISGVIQKSRSKLVPVLAEVECGVPLYNQINQENLKFIETPDVSHYSNPFFVIARGDSMRPYINPGDHLLCIDDFQRIKDGSAVVVNFKTVPETYSSNAKLIKFLDDERIVLYSVNTKFPPVIYKKSGIYKIYKVVRIIREVK